MQIALMTLLAVAAVATAEEVEVRTAKGLMQGVREDTDDGNYYYIFKGIRYAQPPTGQLRFKPPVEPGPWKDAKYDATEDGFVCPQYDISQSEAVGDEDCLYLNVFTPSLENKEGKKRAVMVYIHGGAFIMGAGSSYFFGPEMLLEKDVVLVTLNYRLGPFGFLATEDKSETGVAGNMGLLDQIMALKWVRDNIDAFGGDASKVTLLGEDAGAASATALMMAPEAQGLFHAVIALSGNVLCDQYFQSAPESSAKELATRMQCSTDNDEDLVNCLRRQTQQDIVTESQKLFKFFSFPRLFAPSVDGRVLADHPVRLLEQGRFARVPLVTGQTKDEGAFFYRLTLNSFNNGYYDDNFIDHKLPRLLPVISAFSTKLYPITRQVRKKYFVNVDMESEDEFRPKYIEFLTDLLYTRCTEQLVQTLANHSVPTYEYSFDYRGQYSIVNLQGESVDMGVAHGDDLQYIFANVWGQELSMSASDTKFGRNVFTSLLTNFAKTTVPTPEVTDTLNVAWKPVEPKQSRVLRIGSKLSVDDQWKRDSVKFWNEDIPALLTKKPGKKQEKKAATKEEL